VVNIEMAAIAKNMLSIEEKNMHDEQIARDEQTKAGHNTSLNTTLAQRVSADQLEIAQAERVRAMAEKKAAGGLEAVSVLQLQFLLAPTSLPVDFQAQVARDCATALNIAQEFVACDEAPVGTERGLAVTQNIVFFPALDAKGNKVTSNAMADTLAALVNKPGSELYSGVFTRSVDPALGSMWFVVAAGLSKAGPPRL
jgi:hypothetical protein